MSDADRLQVALIAAYEAIEENKLALNTTQDQILSLKEELHQEQTFRSDLQHHYIETEQKLLAVQEQNRSLEESHHHLKSHADDSLNSTG